MTSAEDLLEELRKLGVVAVLRGTTGQVGDVVDDLTASGLRAVEITYSIPGAAELIRALSTRDDLVVGAGTVTTRDRAEGAIAAGARFLVSPVSARWMIDLANDADVLGVPGCATPTEVATALEWGARAVKIFPAARLGGPQYLRDLAAPMPGLITMPSGGISVSDVEAYRSAGAWCVGLGGELERAPSGATRRSLARAAVAAARIDCP